MGEVALTMGGAPDEVRRLEQATAPRGWHG